MLNSTQIGQKYGNKLLQPTVCGSLITTFRPAGWQNEACNIVTCTYAHMDGRLTWSKQYLGEIRLRIKTQSEFRGV